jgi:hypothetical protein
MKKINFFAIFIIVFSLSLFAQESDVIDTGLAVESAKTEPTQIPTSVPSTVETKSQSTEITPTPEATAIETKKIEEIASPTAVETIPEQKVEIDTEAKDTEGIIILSPGEVEPEMLEKYIKHEKPSKEKIEVETEEKVIAKPEKVQEKEMEEEAAAEEEGGGEISFEYKETEADVVLIEGTPKEKIEKAGFLMVEKAGFISQSFTEDGIISNDSNESLLLQNKYVYVKITVGKGIKKGDRFIVYDDSEEVFNPVNDEYLGRLINVVGVIKIVKKIKENIYKAKIIKNYDLIKDGYKIKLRKELSDYHSKITRKEKKKIADIEGFIVKVKNRDKDSLIRSRDIVFIDKGLDSGLLPGVKMDIIRENENRETGETEKYRVIGQIIVINSMKNTSTAIIVSNNDIIKIGDIVRTVK